MNDHRLTTRGRSGVAGLLALAGLTLSGCISAPTYGPMVGEHRVGWGYSETANVDGGYTIRVALPAILDPQLAFAWWDRRAEELCGGVPARKNIHTAIRPTEYYDRYGARPGDYQLEGYAWCAVPTGPARAAAPATS